MINHIVADSIKSIAKGFKEEIVLSNVSPGVFEHVCEENGWEVDWWGDVIINNVIVHIYGCMYYGTAKLTLGQNE